MSFKTRSSHVLLTLGVLFAVGAASRFIPANLATAEESEAPASTPIPASKTDASNADYAVDDAATYVSEDSDASLDDRCFSPALAEQMTEDRRQLDVELDALADAKLELTAWEAELNARTSELEALQIALDERWQEMRSSAGEDIQHLVRMYSAMKPDRAAEIFDKMDPKFAAGFLRGMKSDQAGLILSNMDAVKAYQVSLDLASKNSDLRKQ